MMIIFSVPIHNFETQVFPQYLSCSKQCCHLHTPNNNNNNMYLQDILQGRKNVWKQFQVYQPQKWLFELSLGTFLRFTSGTFVFLSALSLSCSYPKVLGCLSRFIHSCSCAQVWYQCDCYTRASKLQYQSLVYWWWWILLPCLCAF